ncbi:protein synthesis inhibitor II-like [Diospyros lotus]|uniref:protein synthesis inhibitor II-like n=1 Tax=Diospyros lotus TaxID=55363 RepID=UPI00225A7712|nr:protein synthesis inhibitor II-like [Diospyros lotus]
MPTKYFDVILKVNESISTSGQVTLRIQQDNLYLVGFKNASDHWLEFGNSSSNKLITGSTFLGYNGSYISLQGNAANRQNISLGKKKLKQAVKDLATSTDTRRRAEGLTIVIQMISESMRFRNISTFLSNISNESGLCPPTHVLEQENSWAHISEELLHSDACYNHKFKPPDRQTGITSRSEAIKAIGMIKYFNFSGCKCGSKK